MSGTASDHRCRNHLYAGSRERMVKHNIVVKGVTLSGAAQDKPVLLKMDDDDFPNAFLQDLSAMGKTPLSSTEVMPTLPAKPVTLFQPVTRVFHVALLQLSCEAPGYPRL